MPVIDPAQTVGGFAEVKLAAWATDLALVPDDFGKERVWAGFPREGLAQGPFGPSSGSVRFAGGRCREICRC